MRRRSTKRKLLLPESTAEQVPAMNMDIREQVAERCYLRNMPNEILGMIFGFLSLPDLGRMRCTSKWVNAAFEGSLLGPQLRLVLRVSTNSLMDICDAIRYNPSFDVSVRDILTAFTNQKCECGDYTWLILWFNNPPKRLCRKCLENPEYDYLELRKAAKSFRLRKADYINVPTVEWVPTTTRCWQCRAPPDSCMLAQRTGLEKIAEQKGTKPKKVVQGPYWCGSHPRERPGVIKAPIFDLRRDLPLYPLRCFRCDRKSEFDDGGNQEGEMKDIIIPRDYEYLKQHIILHHPKILKAFEAGWNQLGVNFQAAWLDGGHVGFGTTPPPFWKSWAEVRYDQLQLGQMANISLQDFRNSLTELISQKMPHVGALYDIPDLPRKNNEQPTGNGNFYFGGYHRRSEVSTYDVAGQAVKAILNIELDKLLETVRNDILENGLDAVRKWYPPSL